MVGVSAMGSIGIGMGIGTREPGPERRQAARAAAHAAAPPCRPLPPPRRDGEA